MIISSVIESQRKKSGSNQLHRKKRERKQRNSIQQKKINKT